jgi:xanthine/CO dehydrogenase XdhC/CoxF family maturation factor
MHRLAPTLAAWQETSEQAWLVRALDAVGFGARRDMESMLVRADGEFTGEILGVPVARQIATRVVSAASSAALLNELDLSIHGREAQDFGVTCGGSLHLVVEPISSVPAALLHELQSRTPVGYVSRIDARQPAKLVVDASGASTSTLGDAPRPDDRRAGDRVCASQRRRLRRGSRISSYTGRPGRTP